MTALITIRSREQNRSLDKAKCCSCDLTCPQTKVIYTAQRASSSLTIKFTSTKSSSIFDLEHISAYHNIHQSTKLLQELFHARPHTMSSPNNQNDILRFCGSFMSVTGVDLSPFAERFLASNDLSKPEPEPSSEQGSDLHTVMTNLKLPLDYPPLEDPVDSKIPLHWVSTDRHSSINDYYEGHGWDSRETKFDEIRSRVDQDMEDLFKRSRTKALWALTRAELQYMEMSPCYIWIDLAYKEQDKWKLIDGSVREILKKWCAKIEEQPPPIRYTCAGDYEYREYRYSLP